ncbi:tRNA (adenosine(37)-N6)-threonylcarbamoyltransferase complex transferase subunit TsaD [Spiroplasma endosymbiont of Aspidapion aeneum]|uniref:tRNA (adenosine(37)-N6)-threonylcarbamoyltransferase complex transferase subunit TsaD n=1 Tax=Spiroplasma endosymbiont of Aspidapion aeneum TaxID=3066276 RepID=UPI00313E2276
MVILGIESSCDDFGVSIIKDGNVVSNVVSSQIQHHLVNGGIIPELAARLHVETFHAIFKEAIKNSGLKVEEIECIGFTNEPGLIGSLIIGRIVAKTIASYLNIPIYPLNHMRGHVASAFINNTPIYPVISLVVSGGHTQIVLSKSIENYEVIGETQDDAIGECLDKIARKMGYNYPGGVEIDRLSQKSKCLKFDFPLVQLNNFDMSFSGLKTKALNYINNKKDYVSENINDFANSILNACINQVIEKTRLAIIMFSPKMISLAGGVSANKKLRNDFVKLGTEFNIPIALPEQEYCTDNGAMIAKLLDIMLREKDNVN